MSKAIALIGKGSRVAVDLDSVLDRLPDSLIHSLSVDPVGTVVDYKMTDGTGIGVVLKLADGSINWFFQEELLNPDDENDSRSIDIFGFRSQEVDRSLVNFSKNNKTGRKTYSISVEPCPVGLGLLNPIYFLKWLLYSLKDVY